ncbi:chorismate lyase / 3-hydroxybenzoate synthase [Fontimonas thermophila]|uniref:Chorismate lyase / 3-hydroxybenzoate synthase n=1 Tax=Fontimonas thermophila TaxID=1076937 RepID=A0A1I2H7K3_9GAMM|nr:hypothetical protein [Fontimonas thermophila]SFF25662.1 chorismate lyase / 3-hydroxybenzoate synthase [Fontimonas thermophila]
MATTAPPVLAPTVLACIVHGHAAPPDDDPRRIHVELPALRGPAVEIWESATPVRCGDEDGIRYAENGAVLFGQISVPEAEFEPVEHSVYRIYTRLDGFLRRRGFPAWLRIWNFIAHINRGEADGERYRRFTLGRYQALALEPDFERHLPAATAIGTHTGGLLIYFLAARTPGVQIENPRQISAFRYPRQYGPRSPSFSRAIYRPWADTPDLLVSGTASVVGHETLHAGDAPRQLAETLANIDALLARAAQVHGDTDHRRWQPEQVKLYLREPALLEPIWRPLQQALGAGVPITALQGDICRTDLCLEVETLYRRC